MAIYMPCSLKKGKIVAGDPQAPRTRLRALKCILFQHTIDNA
jgi:hypothetical protein